MASAGVGVQRQEQDAQAICTERGWQVVGVYRDNSISASGRRKHRPATKSCVATTPTGPSTPSGADHRLSCCGLVVKLRRTDLIGNFDGSAQGGLVLRGFRMSGYGVYRLRAGAGVVAGAAASAVLFGLGAAHAAPADDGTNVAVTTGTDTGTATGSGSDELSGILAKLLGIAPASDGDTTTGSVDLLSTATTNFTDASNLLSGIDTSDLSTELQSATSIIGSQTHVLDTVTNALTDKVEPAESAILAHSGSLSGLVDQLFFDPYNQQWVDASESMLNASQAFDSAITDGSAVDMLTASLQMLGTDWFQIIPLSLEFIPIQVFSNLLGDAAGDAAAMAAPDVFDFPF